MKTVSAVVTAFLIMCAKSRNDINKDYYIRHKEQIAAYQREYHKKNHEIVKRKRRERYLANKEKIKKINERWKINNPEKAKESRKKWRIRNRQRYLLNRKRYRERNKDKIKLKKKEHRQKYFESGKETEYARKYLKQKRTDMEWRSKTKKRQTNWRYKKNYGLTLEDVENMKKSQNYCCALCGSKEDQVHDTFVVDHCHKTNKVRGLLCSFCNSALGFFKENTNVMTRAIEYINKHK